MGKTSFRYRSSGTCNVVKRVLVRTCPKCRSEIEFDFSNGETERWIECPKCGQWSMACASEFPRPWNGGVE